MNDTPHHSLAGEVWRDMRELVLDNERRAEVSRALELSFNRVKALMVIGASRLTMRDLAVALGIDAPYATVVVDDLERRGLVERSVSPDDRRVKVVRLTVEGHSAVRHARSILERPPAQVLSLSERDLTFLHRTLSTIVDERRHND